ncbi:MAG: NB-ARC domain-containing protein [Cyanobacteria bacterium P01_H01_bin.21]
MASLKASQHGLVQIKQAIAQKGWKVSSDRWLVEASRVLEPQGNWHVSGPYAYGCSAQTWERFLQGTAIRDRSFIAFCQVLSINPKDVIKSPNRFREDWGDAPDVPNFHGRAQELDTLEKWILEDHTQLVSIVGLAGIGKTRLVRGGIGKTDLSLQLARRIRSEFDYLIWRRLINAPPLTELLTDLIEFISEQQAATLAATPDGLIAQLLQYLRQHRCLLILDNAESILPGNMANLPSGNAGAYRTGYEDYEVFLKRIGETEHQSCLLLTSRIKPQDIEAMEGIWPVRSLELKGLDIMAGRAIFQDIGDVYDASFQGTEEEWDALIAFYNGNPFALEVAARHILKLFDGNLAAFLAHNLRVFGKIRDLLDWHFERFTETEKEITYWLAINREAVSISELQKDVLLPLAKKYIPETLDTLERHIPIEKSNKRFTLQPILIEYITERFIKNICQELQTGNLKLFNHYALIKASAKDYVKESQIRLILQPIIEHVTQILGLEAQNRIDSQLSRILATLRQTYPKRPGYAAGNLLNLMRYGGLDLSGYDFSTLTIWQANLQGVTLHDVNFADCEFDRSSFTQNFGKVHAIAFSPTQNLLAMGDSVGEIRLFHVNDKQPYTHLKGHETGTITGISFSQDGKFLASSSMDSTVRLWDIQTGNCLKTLIGKEQWFWTVAFSPDGQTLASGGDDNTIRLWNIHTGDCQILEGHTAWVWSIAFNSKENVLASGSFDSTIRVWNATTGECLQILNGHKNSVLTVSFHPNGETLVSGSADNTIKVWNVQTGDCLDTLTDHTQEVYSTAFSGDGQIIASGSFDRTAKLWDVQTGKLLKTLKGHILGIRALAFAHHNNLLATGGEDQRLTLWDADTGDCLRNWHGYSNMIWSIAISPDGKWLASCGLDKFVRLWDIHSGQQIATLEGHRNFIETVAFSPNGQFLASGSDDKTVKFWDVRTRQCQKTLHSQTMEVVSAVAFSPNGQWLASSGHNGNIHVWDTATGKNIRCIQVHNDSNWVWAITFSPDSQTLASGSDDKAIRLWDVEKDERGLTIEDATSKIMTLAFHPDGQRLASGGDDNQIKLWDLSNGQLIQTCHGHTDVVLGLLFSPDGDLIVSASADTTVRFWQVSTGQCLRTLEGHSSFVRGLAFTPDGQTLASSSIDKTVRFWDMKTGRMLKVLSLQDPYEGMNIAGTSGLTEAQRGILLSLGAKD